MLGTEVKMTAIFGAACEAACCCDDAVIWDALRAALPRDPTPEIIDALGRGKHDRTFWGPDTPKWEQMQAHERAFWLAEAAEDYRSLPIWRELWGKS